MAGSDEQRGSDSASSASAPGPLSRLLEELARAPAGGDVLAAWRDALSAGDRLDRYEIRREIGRGGFGAVYEAFDSELGRVVAVKTLCPGCSRRELSSDWVKKEAEAVARLDHPCIVTLFDVGTCPSGPYLVMELLRGQTLAQRMERGPLPVDEALRISEEMAKGLAHAHQRGVLHRDLKPANVFLCEGGGVKLLDFGLAHLLGNPRERGAGTPAYMAPEQARGDEVDERSDVYAAGKVLEDMLGERPSRRLDQTVASATSVAPAARPRDGTAWLDLLQARRRAGERQSRLRRLALIAGAGIILGAAVAGLAVRRSLRPPEGMEAPPPPSIAVLPFVDMSPGHDQEYFSDGVAEEILTALARVRGLRVTGRTSSFSFKGKDEPLSSIASKLGVTHVLEGSVRKQGSRVRITAQLVDARDGRSLWSEAYDRELTDVLALQYQISTSVVRTVRVGLLGGPGPSVGEASREPATDALAAFFRGQPSAEAHDQYLVGLHHWRRVGRDGYEAARSALERATALDPGYAPAWALLALLSGNEDLARFPWPEAVAQADRAVALGPHLSETYAARARIRLWLWRWAEAQEDVDRALALNPGDAVALHTAGGLHAAHGRLREWIASASASVESDPLNAQAWNALGLANTRARHFEAARQAYARALTIAPDFQAVRGNLVNLDLESGRYEAAVKACYDESPWCHRVRAVALDALGDVAGARRALDLLRRSLARPGDEWEAAKAYSALGEKTKAFEWLERAVEHHHHNLISGIKTHPDLAPLRNDPRWAALVRKMNLPVD